MYIYNVTVHVDDSVIEDWLTWIKPHIKEVIATGKFTKAIMTEVLADQDSGGRTFSIQYTSNSREDLDKYYEEVQKNGGNRFDTSSLISLLK